MICSLFPSLFFAVKDDTLLDMVQHMTGRIALVHQMPFTYDRDGFAATFEKIFFGTVQSRIYLTADLLGITCHTGMSCLLRADVLRQLGGLRAFGVYLAEDFFIAKAVTDAGWRTSVSSQPALQNSGICDLGSFQARLTRWAKLRQAMMPPMIVMEPLSECMVVGVCASWAVSVLFGWTALVFYLVHVLMWFLSDWVLLSIVQNGALPFNKFEFVVGWLFRECSGPYLFLLALWNPAIRWRSRVYKLAWGGLAYEVDERTEGAEQKHAVFRIAAAATAAATLPLKKVGRHAKANRSPMHVTNGGGDLQQQHYGHNQQHYRHDDVETGMMLMPVSSTTMSGGNDDDDDDMRPANEMTAGGLRKQLDMSPLMQVVVLADGGSSVGGTAAAAAGAATTGTHQHHNSSSVGVTTMTTTTATAGTVSSTAYESDGGHMKVVKS